MPVAIEERPALQIKGTTELVVVRKVFEPDRPEDARKETARWTLSPTEPPVFKPVEFVPGTFSRFTRKEMEGQKEGFYGTTVPGLRLGPLGGGFLPQCLARLGPQMMGEASAKAPWTVRWVEGDLVTQVVFGRTIRAERFRQTDAVAVSAEWDLSVRKGTDTVARAKIATAKGNGWVWLDRENGRPLAARVPWTIDLPSNRGRIELADELTVEPAG